MPLRSSFFFGESSLHRWWGQRWAMAARTVSFPLGKGVVQPVGAGNHDGDADFCLQPGGPALPGPPILMISVVVGTDPPRDGGVPAMSRLISSHTPLPDSS